MKVCLLIPVYNHPHRIGGLLRALARFSLPCVVVDDGSDARTASVLDALAAELGWVHLERRPRNGGRGAAMQTGYRCAHRLGFTHALQLDADGQHSPDDVPALLEAAEKSPEGMILAAPVFDETVPYARLLGRQVSRFWVWVETLGFAIDDPLCGMRLLPLAPVIEVIDRGCGTQMEFDPELLVRLYWRGVGVVNVPARVCYFEDGISHFRPLRDNLRMTWLHTRLCIALPLHVPAMIARRLRRGPSVSWHARRERGSELGIRIVVGLYRLCGDAIARPLVGAIVAYFFATDRRARAASRAYLARVRAAGGSATGISDPPRVREMYRHFLEFGTSMLDRAGFWLGRQGRFSVTLEGREELDRVTDAGEGAIVLGAHLGSFDVMRVYASNASPIEIRVLMYTEHAPRINRVFERLDARSGTSGARLRVQRVDPDGFNHALEARAAVRRGGVVALLADRLPPGAPARTCTVTLLGARVTLPRSPFALARALGAPVLLMSGIRTGRRRYEIRVRRLDTGVAESDATREEGIEQLAQGYADWLTEACLHTPYQWFNFFDVFAERDRA